MTSRDEIDDLPVPDPSIGIEEQVRFILMDRLAPGKGFNLSWRLVEDCGADSLDLVEITMSVEDAFNIEIPDEEAEKLFTGQDIVNYVTPRLKANDPI